MGGSTALSGPSERGWSCEVAAIGGLVPPEKNKKQILPTLPHDVVDSPDGCADKKIVLHCREGGKPLIHVKVRSRTM